MGYHLQNPADTLSWSHTWTQFLAVGDTITSRVWTIEPDGSPSHLSGITTAIVATFGLSKGQVYLLSEKVTTAAGVIAKRSEIAIRCESA